MHLRDCLRRSPVKFLKLCNIGDRLFVCSAVTRTQVGVWRSLVAHLLWEQRVAGSNPVTPTIFCGDSSIGRASAFQADCCGFESRSPLH